MEEEILQELDKIPEVKEFIFDVMEKNEMTLTGALITLATYVCLEAKWK